MNAGAIVGIVLGAVALALLVIFFCLLPCRAYFSAFFSGCFVGAFKLIGMRLRKVDTKQVVNAFVLAKKSHLGITLFDLEMALTSGGHPLKIVEGLNATKAAKLDFDFNFAKAVDISGRDLLDVVRECLSPKTIELPLITSVAQDNFEVNVKISLTLKVNLKEFLTGATEETITARAVEAVVTKIANTERGSDLVARPELVDKTIFDAGVDEECKYELVSADVIHIDLGNNRGLVFEKEQIEKKHIMASNQLEQRRLAAMALEQENKAKAEEARISVIESEMQVHEALVKAIEEGKMKDVLDFYKMENLRADTEMRQRLIGGKTNNNPSNFDEF